MGEAFVAIAPRCPVHGKMFESFEKDRWECHGYDGEGCDLVIRAEEIRWTRITGETLTMNYDRLG